MQNKGCIYSVEQDHVRYNTLCEITKDAGCDIVKPILGDALNLSEFYIYIFHNEYLKK